LPLLVHPTASATRGRHIHYYDWSSRGQLTTQPLLLEGHRTLIFYVVRPRNNSVWPSSPILQPQPACHLPLPTVSEVPPLWDSH
jgi:hypothetical protein